MSSVAKSKSMTESSKFYTNLLPPSTNLSNNECYYKSAELSKESIERNKGDHYTGDDPNPHPCLCENALGWDLKSCSRCYKDRGPERLAEEQRHKEKAQEEDRLQAEIQPHADRIRNLGITTKALINFAYKHNCWLWPTYKVVRDIIVPATSETRCRYAELPELKGCFGPATIFMSHCWGSAFGDLIGAACHGASTNRIVWIDIFAVRQWPGNVADLDFRGVISRCDAVIVSTSPVDGLKEFQGDLDKLDAFLATDEGKAAKKATPFFRLWCIVEIAAAIKLEKEIVVKGGSVKSSHGRYEYDTKCIGDLMNNLVNMIDVDASECAVPADYVREMAVVRSLEGGSKGVNALVAGVVSGAIQSIANNILEIDAFVCNEPESFRALNIPFGCEGEQGESGESGEQGEQRILAWKVLQAACSGGRVEVVQELLSIWNVECEDTATTETTNVKRHWLKRLINDSIVLWHAASGGHVTTLELLLKVKDIDVNIQSCNGSSSFYQAAATSNLNIILVLLQQEGININLQTKDGCSPLFIASQRGCVDIVKRLLLEKNIQVNLSDENNQSPLFMATAESNIAIIKLLLDMKGIDINQVDVNGQTSLFMACFKNDIETVQLLLQVSDIDVNRSDNENNCTPLYLACDHTCVEIVQLLVAMKDIDVNTLEFPSGCSPLFTSVEKDCIEVVHILLNVETIDINLSNESNSTPLACACDNGNVAIACLLLKRIDIDIEVEDIYGDTGLDLAIDQHFKEIVLLFIVYYCQSYNFNTFFNSSLYCSKIRDRE